MPAIDRAHAEAPFALALDIGSSSVRAMLFDRLGRIVDGNAEHRAYAMDTTPDGGVDVDPDALFDVVASAVDGLLVKAGELASVVACVGVSCFWHSLIGVDATGGPATPVLTWADTRSGAQADALRTRLDEHAYHARTGAMLHTSYWPAKLEWLRATDRALFERCAQWISFGEYVFLRLFGNSACSVSMASGTGLFDPNAKSWDAPTLEAVHVRAEQLSAPSDAPAVGLRNEFVARWPALARVPWRPALGDGACSNVGCGAVDPRRVALMVGTSGAMRVVHRAPSIHIPEGLWTYRLDADRFVVGGALSEGGGVFAWLSSLLHVTPDAALEAELETMAPDAHGLTFLPFAAGERSPGWATHARAAIVGMTLDTKPVDILRAALESVAYRFTLIAERLPDFVPNDAEIVGSGGALLRSPVWTQIMADVLARPVRLSAEEEASSRGAALMALESIGAIHDLAEAPAAAGRMFSPDAGRHERYRTASHRQRALYEQLVATEWAAPHRT